MITLNKTPGMGTGTEQGTPAPKITPRPSYPLVGHRKGLRMNDLVTLASAIFILSLEGGTAHEGCGWTPEACRKSQAKHGRGDDCAVHPWL